MPSINDVYGSGETLKADDLPFNMQVPVTIESVAPKQFDDGPKLEIRFVGKRKCLICNKTNARTIGNMYGDDFSFWPGKQILIFRTYTDLRGEQVECIRVVPGPQQQAQQFASSPQQQFAPPPQQYAPPVQQPVNGGGGSPDF